MTSLGNLLFVVGADCGSSVVFSSLLPCFSRLTVFVIFFVQLYLLYAAYVSYTSLNEYMVWYGMVPYNIKISYRLQSDMIEMYYHGADVAVKLS